MAYQRAKPKIRELGLDIPVVPVNDILYTEYPRLEPRANDYNNRLFALIRTRLKGAGAICAYDPVWFTGSGSDFYDDQKYDTIAAKIALAITLCPDILFIVGEPLVNLVEDNLGLEPTIPYDIRDIKAINATYTFPTLQTVWALETCGVSLNLDYKYRPQDRKDFITIVPRLDLPSYVKTAENNFASEDAEAVESSAFYPRLLDAMQKIAREHHKAENGPLVDLMVRGNLLSGIYYTETPNLFHELKNTMKNPPHQAPMAWFWRNVLFISSVLESKGVYSGNGKH